MAFSFLPAEKHFPHESSNIPAADHMAESIQPDSAVGQDAQDDFTNLHQRTEEARRLWKQREERFEQIQKGKL